MVAVERSRRDLPTDASLSPQPLRCRRNRLGFSSNEACYLASYHIMCCSSLRLSIILTLYTSATRGSSGYWLSGLQCRESFGVRAAYAVSRSRLQPFGCLRGKTYQSLMTSRGWRCGIAGGAGVGDPCPKLIVPRCAQVRSVAMLALLEARGMCRSSPRLLITLSRPEWEQNVERI